VATNELWAGENRIPRPHKSEARVYETRVHAKELWLDKAAKSVEANPRREGVDSNHSLSEQITSAIGEHNITATVEKADIATPDVE